jgi:hypothetical protein
MGNRGIYVVAFGEPARGCARTLLSSIARHMPDVPVCLCSDRALGGEAVLVTAPDSDVGGRRAKMRAYELAPAAWEAVLYLDADTELTAPVGQLFEWVENLTPGPSPQRRGEEEREGWEFVICKDPIKRDTLHSFVRSNNAAEMAELMGLFGTLHLLQLNGGVFAFRRCEAVAKFFQRWQREWERYGMRDQGALIRALYAEPLRMLVLGNEWNTLERYCPYTVTAGIMHRPGNARRWDGQLPGRLDSPVAWASVKTCMQKRRGLLHG